LIDAGTAGAAEVVASAFVDNKRGDVVGEKSFGAGAEQQLFALRDGDGLLLTTVKWASSKGKPFLGNDRAGSGITPTTEVKRPELADAVDPDDLTGNDDDAIRQQQNQPNDKRENQPETGPKQQTPQEDIQLKKALELLRDKPASQRAAA
jgi:carboxyl-terminal processing protease